MWRPTKGGSIGTLKSYIDSLERWVEISLYEADKISEYAASIDLADLEIAEYQQILVQHWPIAPSLIKKGLSQRAVVELYNIIITQHPALHPRNLTGLVEYNLGPDMDDDEKHQIMLWFQTKGKKGQTPEVLRAELLPKDDHDAA